MLMTAKQKHEDQYDKGGTPDRIRITKKYSDCFCPLDERGSNCEIVSSELLQGESGELSQ